MTKTGASSSQQRLSVNQLNQEAYDAQFQTLQQRQQQNQMESESHEKKGATLSKNGSQTNMSVFLRKCGSQENCKDLSSNCQVHVAKTDTFNKTCSNLKAKNSNSNDHRGEDNFSQAQLQLYVDTIEATLPYLPASSKTQQQPYLKQSSWMENVAGAETISQTVHGAAMNQSAEQNNIASIQFQTKEFADSARMAMTSLDQEEFYNEEDEEDTARFHKMKLRHNDSVNSLLDMEATQG